MRHEVMPVSGRTYRGIVSERACDSRRLSHMIGLMTIPLVSAICATVSMVAAVNVLLSIANMRPHASYALIGAVGDRLAERTQWWSTITNTGLTPLYEVRLATVSDKDILIANVIRAGETYQMHATLPLSVCADMHITIEEAVVWESGTITVSCRSLLHAQRRRETMRICDSERKQGEHVS